MVIICDTDGLSHSFAFVKFGLLLQRRGFANAKGESHLQHQRSLVTERMCDQWFALANVAIANYDSSQLLRPRFHRGDFWRVISF